MPHRRTLAPKEMLTRASQSPATIGSAVLLAAAACAAGGGWSSTIEPDLQLEGLYQWLDSYGHETGCRVHIFTQGQKYRGWVRWDPMQPRDCPWEGYELYQFEVRGYEVRLTVCPPSRCGRTPGVGEYALNVVPRVSLKGRLVNDRLTSSPQSLLGHPRWREATWVYLGN
jgi:hypothetical protein